MNQKYNSDEFRAHNIYPSTNVSFVYAVISMCLELKAMGYTDDRIIPAVDEGKTEPDRSPFTTGKPRLHHIIF